MMPGAPVSTGWAALRLRRAAENRGSSRAWRRVFIGLMLASSLTGGLDREKRISCPLIPR
jgi:hypothetical protein